MVLPITPLNPIELDQNRQETKRILDVVRMQIKRGPLCDPAMRPVAIFDCCVASRLVASWGAQLPFAVEGSL